MYHAEPGNRLQLYRCVSVFPPSFKESRSLSRHNPYPDHPDLQSQSCCSFHRQLLLHRFIRFLNSRK
ncbi:hypothetical protein CS542_02235 [Pedobacter sp. IW39]|nr:hypothetical protein CS542_02235 [Pedobacter sp. IW39]